MTDIKIIQGEFFTPDIWAKKSHEFIEEELGLNWKKKYLVWDCAAGQGALVKDLKIDKLFLSTINENDTIFLKENFKEAGNFQFDFLNDDESKMPENLIKSLSENIPILFYINPPFGKTYTSSEQHLSERKYFPATKLFYEQLEKEKFGKTASSQLYIQFLYKIIFLKKKFNLTNIKLALFAPPFFLTGGSFEKFRTIFFEHFSFKNGFLMDAINFDSVSSWRLSFSLFDGLSSKEKNVFNYHVLDLDENIVSEGKKRIYNLDNSKQALKWIKEGVPKTKIDCPQISNPLKFKADGRGYICEEALGFFYNDTNYIKTNVQGVAIFSTGFYKGLGSPITKENFLKVASLFTARRVFLKPKWFETHDEYLVPNEDSDNYKEWNDKALVYCLFNNKSFQTSLRSVSYKEKKWNIKNHFFWISKKIVKDLATLNNNTKILDDMNDCDETFICNYIEKSTAIKNSKETMAVLNSIEKLFEKSFSKRETFDEKYQLNCWDAGYAQLKWLWKKEFKNEYKEFKKNYKKLEESLAKDVYKFGFLIK